MSGTRVVPETFLPQTLLTLPQAQMTPQSQKAHLTLTIAISGLVSNAPEPHYQTHWFISNYIINIGTNRTARRNP